MVTPVRASQIREKRELHVEISSLRRRTQRAPEAPARAEPECLPVQPLSIDGAGVRAGHPPSQPLPQLPLQPSRRRDERRPPVGVWGHDGAHRHLGPAPGRVVHRAPLCELRRPALQPDRRGRQRVRARLPGGAASRPAGVPLNPSGPKPRTRGWERTRFLRGPLCAATRERPPLLGSLSKRWIEPPTVP